MKGKNTMKTNILFIVPQLTQGGSNRSLEVLLKVMESTSDYLFHVISLNDDYIDKPYYKAFKEKLLKLSKVYRTCIHHAILRKTLNALHNYLQIDLWTPLYFYEARRLQRKYSFDKVIGYEESYATRFAACFDIPKIGWIHCDYNAYKLASNGLDESAMYAKFEKIVCVSKYAQRVFIEHYPQFASKTICIYNMLDIPAIRQAATDSITDSRFITSDCTIVSVGRINPIKQFHMIPAFAKKMTEIDADVKFRWYIIGDGASHYQDMIDTEISHNNVEGKVIMLGGKTNPYPYIQEADLLVCTSKTESWSYVINEAKALHTPVVTLRCGSSDEVIEENVGYITTKEELPTLLVHLIKDDNGIYSNIKYGVRKYEYNGHNNSTIAELQKLLDVAK